MGALALETGGVTVDHGWVRILGAAGDAMKQGLVEWNNLRTTDASEHTIPNALLIGHDAIGGFFALNGGKWPEDLGGVYYWSQDTLEWTKLGTTYSGWLQWVLNGDLGQYYETLRWTGWQVEIAQLPADQGISVYPFPWAKEGGPIASRSRRPVPMRELWAASNEIAVQLTDLPPWSQVEIHITEADHSEEPT